MKVVLPLFFAIAASVLNAQGPPAFDTVSIRPVPIAGNTGVGELTLSRGRFTVSNLRLDSIIHQVYGLPSPGEEHGPARVFEVRNSYFDIEATAADNVDGEQLKLMAQQLLVTRFHLQTHGEMQIMPAFALVVAGNGLGRQIAKDTGAPRGSGSIQYVDIGSIRGNNVSFASLAKFVEPYIGRPIVDQTNLTDPIDFALHWALGDNPRNGPSILVAIHEQLGLDLRQQNLPVEVLFIDNVEPPTPN